MIWRKGAENDTIGMNLEACLKCQNQSQRKMMKSPRSSRDTGYRDAIKSKIGRSFEKTTWKSNDWKDHRDASAMIETGRCRFSEKSPWRSTLRRLMAGKSPSRAFSMFVFWKLVKYRPEQQVYSGTLLWIVNFKLCILQVLFLAFNS